MEQAKCGLQIMTSNHHAMHHTKTFLTNGAARVPEMPVSQNKRRNAGMLGRIARGRSVCLSRSTQCLG